MQRYLGNLVFAQLQSNIKCQRISILPLYYSAETGKILADCMLPGKINSPISANISNRKYCMSRIQDIPRSRKAGVVMRLLLILLMSSVLFTASAKVLCFWDDTVKHWGAESKERPIGEVGDKSIGVYFNDLRNEKIDQANSQYWIRLEMIQKPTDLGITANLIFWQWSAAKGFVHCWSHARPTLPNEGGVIYYPLIDMLNFGHDGYKFPPEFDRLNHDRDLVAMHCWKGGTMEKMWYDPHGHPYRGDDLDEHTPYTYYTTCYIVPKGERPLLPAHWKDECPEAWRSKADFENSVATVPYNERSQSAAEIKCSVRNGVMHVEVPFAGAYSVEIVDCRGRITETIPGKAATMDIALSNRAKGASFIRVVSKSGAVQSSFIRLIR